jgi:hypothetical protein
MAKDSLELTCNLTRSPLAFSRTTTVALVGETLPDQTPPTTDTAPCPHAATPRAMKMKTAFANFIRGWH